MAESWGAALDSQAQAFLLGVQAAARPKPDGGRIVAATYAHEVELVPGRLGGTGTAL
jgi:hypothetical protein